jgi:glycosyltransferase involved in cell wall biosynthesis
MSPFLRGGADELADDLCAHLNRTPGVQAELLRIPFAPEPFERLPDEIFLNRTLQVQNVDRMIALRFPAYLIPHEKKVFWLLHQYRQAYDLRCPSQSNIPDTPRGEEVIGMIRRSDNEVFSSAHKIFANSEITKKRLKHYNGFAAEVLLTPLNRPELFENRGDDGYLFAGGRIHSGNRQHLLVEAMRFVKSKARLIVAGAPETAQDGERLLHTIERFQLHERAVLDFGFHSSAKIAEYVNHARACAYIPIDEDSLGHVTMEAFAATKPIITLSDSGGILQLVRDRETGRVTEPDPGAIADAIDWIFSDPFRAARLGQHAKSVWDSLGVTWPKTIEKLLS